ncbi:MULTISPECIES: hypothetical protein [unclassified Cupriavidus]
MQFSPARGWAWAGTTVAGRDARRAGTVMSGIDAIVRIGWMRA